jgi:hypothetical protein
MNKILPENDKNQNNVQSMRPNWDTINLTGTPLQIFFVARKCVKFSFWPAQKVPSNFEVFEVQSVPDWAQIEVCGVPVRAHGLYFI